MQFVDSHCHLHLMDLEKLGADIGDLVTAAMDNGVSHMLCVATRLEQLETLKTIANAHSNVSISLGLHPNEPDETVMIDKMVQQVNACPDIVAVGETGLDFYRHTVSIEEQKSRFRAQVEVAKQTKKPLIIHSRDAKSDLVEVLRDENAEEVGGVIHCFTEDLIKFSQPVIFIIFFSSLNS